MIPLYKAFIPGSAIEHLPAVFSSGQIADGAYVRDFEKALQDYLGNPQVVSAGDVSSGILLALMLAGVRPGDEVLASPMACVATNQPILNAHARVRWCDVDSRTGMITPETLTAAITPQTRALVHPLWAGDVPEIDEINRVAKAHGIAVVEDAGEALGAAYRGRKIGNTGSDYTVFSFHAIRHITTGEGAALAMRDPAQAERAQWLKRYGIHRPSFRDQLGEIDPASDIPVAGLNSYLTNVAAAIGVVQLARLPGVVARHRENGQFYEAALRDIPGLQLCDRPPHRQSAYWVYTLLADRRDELLRALRARGVYASRVHLRNDTYTCFGGAKPEVLPGLEQFAARYLCLPSGWWVDGEQRQQVVEAIVRGW